MPVVAVGHLNIVRSNVPRLDRFDQRLPRRLLGRDMSRGDVSKLFAVLVRQKHVARERGKMEQWHAGLPGSQIKDAIDLVRSKGTAPNVATNRCICYVIQIRGQ